MSVTSEAGKGSVFTFTLPLSVEKPAAPVAVADVPERETLLHGHILLAEDNDNIRLLVHEYLARAGARVTGVVNGLEAVEKIATSMRPSETAVENYDLVLLDLHMPALDGLNAMKQMRRIGYTGPIVGLTADFAENQSHQRANEGWDAMCAKPIDRRTFLPLLANMMRRRPVGGQGDVRR